MMKKAFGKNRILLIILLLPLLFINVKNSHDWGDDFAQYLIQARNIVEGRPQTDNGLLQNVNDPSYAIEAYPVGLPLLIAPVYFFFGLNIFPYCILFSVVLFITGILIFEFFRNKTNDFIAILITLLFCYNVNILELKKQILSELPFTCLMLLSLIWLENHLKYKKYSWLITGIIFSALVSVRLAGFTIVAGYSIFEMTKLFRVSSEIRRRNIKNLVYSLATFGGIFILVNGIIFPIRVGGLLNFYSHAFSSHELQVKNNIGFYYTVSEYIFPFYGSWVSSTWVFLAISGWLIKTIKSATVLEFIFPVYCLLLLFYPYANAGIRFLLPILPFLIYYSGYLINWLFTRLDKKSFWISAAVFIIILFAYVSPLKNIIRWQNDIEDGPQQQSAIQLFDFLKSAPKDVAMVFCKARAMALYSNHNSLYTAKKQSDEDSFIQFHRYKSLFLIIARASKHNEIYDPRLLDYISKYKNQYERIWENDLFDVYRQN